MHRLEITLSPAPFVWVHLHIHIVCFLSEQKFMFELVAPKFRKVGLSDQGDLLERFVMHLQ